MIDLQLDPRQPARRTAAILLSAQTLYVVRSVGTAILGFARATVLYVCILVGAPCNDIGRSPFTVVLKRLLFIILFPALRCSAVASGVFRASFAGLSGVASEVLGVPFAAPFHAALDANPVRYPALVVAVLAWLARRVVALAALSRRYARRMVWPLGLAAHRGLAGARRASTADDGPLGEVSFATRLAGEVKTLASGYRGRALRACSHILIVIEDGVKGHQFHAR